MTAALADLRELTCPLSAFAAFAAFQDDHFLSAFAAFNSSSKKIILGPVDKRRFQPQEVNVSGRVYAIRL
jgi:hypothetical protein